MRQLPSLIIFVVEPLPSSFQVPTIPSPRLAFAEPSADKVISNGLPSVPFTVTRALKDTAADAEIHITARTRPVARILPISH